MCFVDLRGSATRGRMPVHTDLRSLASMEASGCNQRCICGEESGVFHAMCNVFQAI